MAFLVPDNLRSRKDVPETIRRVAAAFQVGLESDVTVWYEPIFDPSGDLPHLVVLEPRLGVLVLEVLNGNDFLGAIKGKLQVAVEGAPEQVDDPLVRASRFADVLRASLEGSPTVAGVGVAPVAVFPCSTRKQAEERGAGTVLDLDRCIFKSDIDEAIRECGGTGVLRVFHRAIGAAPDRELSSTQLDLLRALIHPDVVITPGPVQGALFTPGEGADIIKVMDRKQEALAKSLGSGHRVIRGVAGSGKTLVLVYRARLLARLLPSSKILVTCYTKALASQLRRQLAEYEKIDVINLDKLMSRAIKDAALKHPAFKKGAPAVAPVALQAVEKTGGGGYRAILVDEAQDFDSDALEFCVKLFDATDADEQDLVVVADSAQNIFRKDFRWKDAGIKAQGRTRLLRVNYRNTREVLDFAHRFLTLDPDIVTVEVPESDDELTIVPAESAERSGPAPEVTLVANRQSELDAIVQAAVSWGAKAAPSRSIAVLIGDVKGGACKPGQAIVAALEDQGISVFWVNDPKSPTNKDEAGSADEAVIVSTIQSAKGLEFSKVIVTGLGIHDDSTTARKLLYVGFTRAVDELHVVGGVGSPFAADLQAAMPATAG